jgi:hypothetical protein
MRNVVGRSKVGAFAEAAAGRILAELLGFLGKPKSRSHRCDFECLATLARERVSTIYI